ncbi:MAG TPA: hypothetical protein VKY36_06535 [Moheibacter sp.]|nr:hypothetical protein [Moheibacter sp.]
MTANPKKKEKEDCLKLNGSEKIVYKKDVKPTFVNVRTRGIAKRLATDS